MQFSAGQWADVYVPDEDVNKAGGFTLASSPFLAASNTSPYFELAVKREIGNPPAAWLWQLPEKILGRKLQIRIGGSFVYPPMESMLGIRRVIFVAGGVGINPLMSMISYLADQNSPSPLHISVLYGTKICESGDLHNILFLERILSLFETKKISGSLKLYITNSTTPLSRSSLKASSTDLAVFTRRMTGDDIVQEFQAGGPPKSALVYICGPPDMTDTFSGVLTSPAMANILDPSNIKTEKWW